MATINLVPPLFAHLVTACDETPQPLEPSHNSTGGFRHVHLSLPKVPAVYVMTDTSYGRSTSTVCVSSSNEALLPSCMQTPQHSSWAVSRCHYLAPCQECDENSSCMVQEARKHPVCPRGILRSRSSFLPFIDSADSRTYLLYDITKHRHQFCSLRRTSIHPVGYREQ